MYSMLSSIISYPFSFFTKNSTFGESKFENPRPNLNEFFAPNDMSVYHHHKNFIGVITSLCNGEGVVNNEIYFSTEIKKNYFKIGEKVEGIATRQSNCSSWRAVKISHAQDEWESDSTFENTTSFNIDSELGSLPSMTIVGKITSIYMDLISMSNNISFNYQNCVSDLNVHFVVGDWLECKLDNTQASHVPFIRQVSPLRRKTIHGVVSYCHRTYFIINDEVYCRKSSADNFKYNTKVVAEVIESDQHKYSWRAIKVWRDEDESFNSLIVPDTFSYFKNLSKNEGIILQKHEALLFKTISEDKLLERDIIVKGIDNITLNGLSFVDYFKISIKNNSKNCDYQLEDVLQISDTNQLMIDNSLNFPIILQHAKFLSITFMCTGKKIGSSVETIILKISNGVVIEKSVEITVLKSNKPLTRQIQFNGYESQKIIKGTQPLYASPFIPTKLLKAEIPVHLWEAVLNEELALLLESLKEPLCPQNYEERFSTLLFLEEIEMTLQLRKFDIPCTPFSEHGEYLSLVVEGLSEKRPSLMVGDSVLAFHPSASSSSSASDIKYEGVIHEVLHSKVLLKFHPTFHSSYGGEDYAVQLCFNRTPMRRCHQAVLFALNQLQNSVLFPKTVVRRSPQVEVIPEDIKFADENKMKDNVELDKNGAKILKWFQKSLNDKQRKAVLRVLEGRNRPIPYVIFGPPGTGKTVTLVEVILQIFYLIPHSRILVVTPSNSACDLITERIIKNSDLKPGNIIRINAYNRNLNTISSEIVPYCNTNSDLKMAIRHRIIISTATTSGSLYTSKVKNGHFTHVIVDEAGQLTEPETLVALNFVNSDSGQIVLAGDPKQLGPVVISSIARKFGLNNSLLHRLCSSVLYQPQDPNLRKIYMGSANEQDEGSSCTDSKMFDVESYYDSGLVTLLTENYRSHPELLHVPSKLFYNSLLLPSPENKKKNVFLDWKELPNPSCPLLFHPVIGENLQEGDSPSWFNPSEIFMVCHYTLHILKFGIEPHNIGIISPYKKQVEKIRNLLKSFDIVDSVKVGPVEEFQGQEKLAIIVSTVRSSHNLVQDDVFHNLGFVRCSRRFNVAITRAIGLLIVVGNPFLLSEDENWKEFINFCIAKNAAKRF